MCLGIPGKIISIFDDHGTKMAKVDFGGVLRDICLELIPEAKIGDWTIVHAGFALNLLNEEDALETLGILHEMTKLAEGNDLENRE